MKFGRNNIILNIGPFEEIDAELILVKKRKGLDGYAGYGELITLVARYRNSNSEQVITYFYNKGELPCYWLVSANMYRNKTLIKAIEKTEKFAEASGMCFI